MVVLPACCIFHSFLLSIFLLSISWWLWFGIRLGWVGLGARGIAIIDSRVGTGTLWNI